MCRIPLQFVYMCDKIGVSACICSHNMSVHACVCVCVCAGA